MVSGGKADSRWQKIEGIKFMKKILILSWYTLPFAPASLNYQFR